MGVKITLKNHICLFLFLLLFLIRAAAAQDSVNDLVPAGTIDLKTRTVLLNTGYEMPVIGVSFPESAPEKVEELVYQAIAAGFRLIDLSGSYKNETAAGRGISRALEEKIITREELFVTVMMWIDRYEDGESAIAGTLERLGLDYVDLMLLRQGQFDRDMEAYQAMEQALSSGRIRSLGLSDFYEVWNYDLVTNAVSEPPAVISSGIYPYQQNRTMKDHVSDSAVVMISSEPMGGEEDSHILFADFAVSSIATWYSKTSDQIILRWQLQSGNAAVPTVGDVAKLSEILEIFDFELEERDMERIDALDRGQLLVDFFSEDFKYEY
ncbi:MAG: aldo/keto reductase [Anaerolineaceae bacterium]|nr:aldo/keto reductase [Anaerolineaceae bacterium]